MGMSEPVFGVRQVSALSYLGLFLGSIRVSKTPPGTCSALRHLHLHRQSLGSWRNRRLSEDHRQ